MSSPLPSRPAPRAGRPRRPGLDDAILDACVDQLHEVGYHALTFEAVARAAGIGRPTLYRRWSSKPEMVIAALVRRYGDRPVPDTGSLRGDLLAAQTHTAELLSDVRTVHILAALLADLAQEPDLDRLWSDGFLAPRRRSWAAALERAAVRGEWNAPVSPTWAADWLTGPLLSHVLFSRVAIEPGDVEATVDRFLAAFT